MFTEKFMYECFQHNANTTYAKLKDRKREKFKNLSIKQKRKRRKLLETDVRRWWKKNYYERIQNTLKFIIIITHLCLQHHNKAFKKYFWRNKGWINLHFIIHVRVDEEKYFYVHIGAGYVGC